MKRTTLALEPGMLREVKLREARAGTSLQVEVNALPRQALRTPARAGGARLELKTLKLRPFDTTLNPGVDLLDRNSLYRSLEGR